MTVLVLAGTIGAKKLHEIADTIELNARENSVDAVGKAIDKYEIEHNIVFKSINKLSKKYFYKQNDQISTKKDTKYKEKAIALLKKLNILLDDDHSLIEDCLHSIKQQLKGESNDLVKQLEALIRSYDFENAKEMTTQIIKTLST